MRISALILKIAIVKNSRINNINILYDLLDKVPRRGI